MSNQNRFQGSLLGLAVGDALGCTLEFKKPGTFEPITTIVGGGVHKLKAGQWTDDTSLALCLAQSLIDCKGFDAKDQMQKYCKWDEEGYMSSTGECFDIGNTTLKALNKFRATGEPFSCISDDGSQEECWLYFIQKANYSAQWKESKNVGHEEKSRIEN